MKKTALAILIGGAAVTTANAGILDYFGFKPAKATAPDQEEVLTPMVAVEVSVAEVGLPAPTTQEKKEPFFLTEEEALKQALEVHAQREAAAKADALAKSGEKAPTAKASSAPTLPAVQTPEAPQEMTPSLGDANSEPKAFDEGAGTKSFSFWGWLTGLFSSDEPVADAAANTRAVEVSSSTQDYDFMPKRTMPEVVVSAEPVDPTNAQVNESSSALKGRGFFKFDFVLPNLGSWSATRDPYDNDELNVKAAERKEEAKKKIEAPTTAKVVDPAPINKDPEQIYRIEAGKPIHEQLQAWASSAGWIVDWKHQSSWIAPANAEFKGRFDQALESVINQLYAEGKSIKLLIWANKYAEIVDVSAR